MAADNLPVSLDFDDFGPRSLIATLDGGKIHGSFIERNFTIWVEGVIRDGVLYVGVYGPLSYQAVSWQRGCTAEGNTKAAAGHVALTLNAICEGNVPNTSLKISFDLPASAVPAPSTASSFQSGGIGSLPVFDPIYKPYVASASAVVRDKPDALSAAIKTLTAGQTIDVMGKVKDKPWYLVSEAGKPLGYVAVDQIVPVAQ